MIGKSKIRNIPATVYQSSSMVDGVFTYTAKHYFADNSAAFAAPLRYVPLMNFCYLHFLRAELSGYRSDTVVPTPIFINYDFFDYVADSPNFDQDFIVPATCQSPITTNPLPFPNFPSFLSFSVETVIVGTLPQDGSFGTQENLPVVMRYFIDYSLNNLRIEHGFPYTQVDIFRLSENLHLTILPDKSCLSAAVSDEINNTTTIPNWMRIAFDPLTRTLNPATTLFRVKNPRFDI